MTQNSYSRLSLPLVAAALLVSASAVQAGQLIYKSGDPSFGGSPLLDEFLLNLADIQNKHRPEGGGGGSGGAPSINFPPITIDLGGGADAATNNPALDTANSGVVPSQ
ncbi:curli production assembly/transport component CsgF [Nitratireductor pacificus]|uniref:Curli production assembly/transport component CsgF n=1 Tax=Nitratireductor pacificus pht-3B TaxID=391937 RepID=K2MCP4_9HYPH|nr:curli production assembly/transport component CsgF [Nitratireductor pacificus]EKF19956.1 curli production assembly/transport component CsgF [Nitratireductor pacificus pht-3B]